MAGKAHKQVIEIPWVWAGYVHGCQIIRRFNVVISQTAGANQRAQIGLDKASIVSASSGSAVRHPTISILRPAPRYGQGIFRKARSRRGQFLRQHCHKITALANRSKRSWM